jgi:hypothetical protein
LLEISFQLHLLKQPDPLTGASPSGILARFKNRGPLKLLEVVCLGSLLPFFILFRKLKSLTLPGDKGLRSIKLRSDGGVGRGRRNVVIRLHVHELAYQGVVILFFERFKTPPTGQHFNLGVEGFVGSLPI